MKPKLRDHIYYNWWFYILSAVIAVALWLSIFGKLSEPKPIEQINITYIGSHFDNAKLQSDLYDILPDTETRHIKRISVENAVVEGEYDFNTIVRARMSGNCDLIIIETAVLEKYKVDLASYFAEVDSASMERVFGEVKSVVSNGKIYGIEIENDTVIYDYYNGTSNCKIFFNKNSRHLSDLFGGDAEQNSAIAVIEYLTGRRQC